MKHHMKEEKTKCLAYLASKSMLPRLVKDAGKKKKCTTTPSLSPVQSVMSSRRDSHLSSRFKRGNRLKSQSDWPTLSTRKTRTVTANRL